MLTSESRAKMGAKSFKHGYYKHPLYNVWRNMMSSCYNPKSANYETIGALEIKVCDRWHKVENFVNDIGTKPRSVVFTRPDLTKDFGPDNYTWEYRSTLNKKKQKPKISDAIKKQIIGLKSKGVADKVIAKVADIHPSTVNRIYCRYISEQTTTKRKWQGEDSINDVINLRKSGMKIMDIAASYNVSFTHIQNILNKAEV